MRAQGSPQGPVAVALYRALTTDAVVSGLVGGRIYEVRPRARVALPMLLIDPPQLYPSVASGMGGFAWEITVQLHVWSDDRTHQGVQAIISALTEALHVQRLDVVGYTTIDCACEFVDALSEPDDDAPDRVLRHHVAGYRVTVQQ